MTDQTTPLRDRIAAALYERERPRGEPAWTDARPADREVFEAMADAVLAVLPAPVDRAALRETLRRVLAEADGFSYECLEPHDCQKHVDGVLAAVLPATTNHDTDTVTAWSPCSPEWLRVMPVGACSWAPRKAGDGATVSHYHPALPAPVDRAAVLREADWIVEHCPDHGCVEPSSEACHCEVADRLRRVADETAATETDTLPSWLHWRFGPHGQPWAEVPDEDKSLWEHQARAVRRAVARGGFKQPAAGARQDGSAS